MYEFAAVQQTSPAKLPAFFQKFEKTWRALGVCETKVTSRNAFTVNLFALKSEKKKKKKKKKSKNDEMTFFR